MFSLVVSTIGNFSERRCVLQLSKMRGFFVTSLQVSCSDVTACSFTVRRVANSLLYWATYKIATFPPILFNKPPSPISRFHQKFIKKLLIPLPFLHLRLLYILNFRKTPTVFNVSLVRCKLDEDLRFGHILCQTTRLRESE